MTSYEGVDSGGLAADRSAVAPRLRRLHPLTPIFNSWRMIGAAGAVGFGTFRDDLGQLKWIWEALQGDADFSTLIRAVALLFVVAVISIVAAWLSWRVTGFAIMAGTGHRGTLLFHRGLVVRQRSQVRLDRVQSVDVNQPFVPRLFGLAAVRLEMAAGEGASVNLSYLRAPDAWLLRQELLRHSSDEAGSDGLAAQSPRPGEELIAQISTGRLVKANLLDGASVWLLLLVWVIVVVGSVVVFGWAIFGAALAGIVPVGIAIAVQLRQQVASMMKDANFRLVRTPTGIRISSGLTSTINKTIDLDRVQSIRVEEPYLWRRLGWARVKVDVAGAAGGEQGASLMPVAERADAFTLVADVTGARLGDLQVVRAGRAAKKLDPLGYEVAGVALLAEGAVTRSGRWRRTDSYVPYARVQSVSAQQGVIQRGLGLATVYLDLPQGASRWVGRHRDLTDAAYLVEELTKRARVHRVTP
ncbi:MAG: PH domain-containing protein [Nocardioidaceae bacterium]|nr:PH domain-containing protein [Nocardioidaceae bacterium]